MIAANTTILPVHLRTLQLPELIALAGELAVAEQVLALSPSPQAPGIGPAFKAMLDPAVPLAKQLAGGLLMDIHFPTERSDEAAKIIEWLMDLDQDSGQV